MTLTVFGAQGRTNCEGLTVMPTLSPCLGVFGNQKHAFKVRSSSNETKDSFVAIYLFGNNVLQIDIGQYLNMLNQSKYCMRKLSCGRRDNISYKQVVDSAHFLKDNDIFLR